MRWVGVVPILLALSVAALPAAGPALAEERPVPIKVRIGGKGHGDAKITVRDMDTRETREVETDGGGRAQVTVPPGAVYEVTVIAGDSKGAVYLRPEAGQPNEVRLDTATLPKPASLDDANAHETLIGGMTAAAGACDRPRYDALKADYDRLQTSLEKTARELDAIAEQYADETGVPPDANQLRPRAAAVSQLIGGGGGSVKQARNAGVPVDPAIFKLRPYLAVVEQRDRLRERLRAMAAARARIPEFPKECSRSAACPPGQSGGLLAGAVNDLFGTDLAGVCDEPRQQRRDTERSSGSNREHDRRD